MFSILDGNNLYFTEVTILNKTLELTNCPISMIANGEIKGFVEIPIGINPR